MKTILALAALAVLALIPATADGADAAGGGAAQESERAGDWTRTLSRDLSARDLGLSADASAQRLAKAALERSAGRLGLRGSVGSLRLDRRLRTPAADGARALTQLRFQQTAGSLRVIWSQIDVTVAAGEVSAIAATVVPARSGPAAGERLVSRKRALGIALRSAPGGSEALSPLPAAYAGTPTAKRDAKPKAARRAWVVEVQPPPEPGEEAPTPLCIVVDAETGKVIGRWPGIADRPDRGPQARGARATPEGVTAGAAQANPKQFLLDVFDGTNVAAERADPLDGTSAYAAFVIDGDPRVGANWPPFTGSPPWQTQCAPGTSDPPPCFNLLGTSSANMEAVATNARNVAFTICGKRDYCGRLHGLVGDSGNYFPWQVIGNGKVTRTYASSLVVEIAAGDEMDGTCPAAGECGSAPYDPRGPFNDLVAHEFGHVMDFVYAGDRAIDEDDMEARSVQEALADMFAYDYDHDGTLGEQTGHIGIRWDDPAGYCPYAGGVCFPDHMDDYDPVPPPPDPGGDPDEHFNSTILSHAYYLLVDDVGADRAGEVLQYVPFSLSPKPTFGEVARAFIERAHDLYGGTVSAPAQAAFEQVGIGLPVPGPPEDPDCGPKPC